MRGVFATMIMLVLALVACGRISYQSGVRDAGTDGPIIGDGITLTTSPRVVNRADEARFLGTCEGDVTVTGAASATFPCVAGTYEVIVRATTDGMRAYALSRVGATGAPIDVVWIRDSVAPIVEMIALDDGAAVTTDNTVAVDLRARDDGSFIPAFCLRWRAGPPPLAGDPCFVNVAAPMPGLAPASTLALGGFSFRLGFGAGQYTVWAFVADEAGNVSVLGAAGAGVLGVDKDEIEYRPGAPPVVIDVFATSTRTPASPPALTDLVVPRGAPVHVTWAARDDAALPAAPISVWYTLDERTYTLVADGLANGPNGACVVNDPGTAIDDGATGCFTWPTSVSDAYMRIRVVAEDADQQATAASAPPLNSGRIQIVAGNIDPGTDASARAAVFASAIYRSNSDYAGVGGLAVAADGTIYFRDVRRGILVVRPVDGVQRVLVATTGTSGGDGGPLAGATLRLPFKIALDHQGRLLVLDYDRIRRIDESVPGGFIDTLIGGGAERTDVVAATDLEIVPPHTSDVGVPNIADAPLFALPDGDVVFQSDGYRLPPAMGQRYRRYDAATGVVGTLRVAGSVSGLAAGQNVTSCTLLGLGVEYDLVTSAISHAQVGVWARRIQPACPAPDEAAVFAAIDPVTGIVTGPGPSLSVGGGAWTLVLASPFQGLDGRLYLMGRSQGRIFGFDRTAGVFEVLVGTGVRGRCADGTPALACDIEPMEAFVDARGQLFFVDVDRLRVIDEEGNVRTIAGQSLDFGDGGTPTSARFGDLAAMGVWNDGSADRYVVTDRRTGRIREIEPRLVTTLAGTGLNAAPALGAVASASSILLVHAGSSYHGLAVEPTTGAVWFQRGPGAIARLDRSTGRWEDRIGGGASPYYSIAASGLAGTDVDLDPAGVTAYPAMLLGTRSGTVLAHAHSYDPTLLALREALMFEARTTDGRLARIVGVPGMAEPRCTEGMRIDSCAPGFAPLSLPAVYDAMRGIWVWGYRDSPYVWAIDATTINVLADAGAPLAGFGYDERTGQIYACGTDGQLRIVPSGGAALATPLLPEMQCTGAMRYVIARDVLAFAFNVNGLAGVAEMSVR